jgi:hypothetical protein
LEHPFPPRETVDSLRASNRLKVSRVMLQEEDERKSDGPLPSYPVAYRYQVSASLET